MLFSVVIPTYNRSQLLRVALDSVFAQTFTDYEVIVADDGSTDGTREMVAGYGLPLKCFRQENAGPGAARNLGVSHARGDYIAFLDSDDFWFPWTLSVFAKLIRENASPSILAAKTFEFWQDGKLPSLENESPKAEWFADYYASASKHYSVGVGMAVVRRDQFAKMGGFTQKRMNAEDHDLMMRMGTAPGFVQVRSPYTLTYRRHDASKTGDFLGTFAGVAYLLEQEERGAYPGGVARAGERREILTLHIRPVTSAALKNGFLGKAWKLYRKTIAWHLQQGRWRFLLGFPLMAAISLLRKNPLGDRKPARQLFLT
jgi:glycosyltransferase involved in cell wall biosynthesis